MAFGRGPFGKRWVKDNPDTRKWMEISKIDDNALQSPSGFSRGRRDVRVNRRALPENTGAAFANERSTRCSGVATGGEFG